MNSNTRRLLLHSVESQHKTTREMLGERQDQPRLARIGKVGLYKLGGKLLQRVEDHFDSRIIASGQEQIVLKNQTKPTVTKVLIDTIGLSTSEIEARAREHQYLSDKCQQYLDGQWVETVFQGLSLPRWMGRQAVVATQPFVAAAKCFESPQEVSNYRLDEGYKAELGSLVLNIANLYEASGMLPDLFGVNNIVLAASTGHRERLRILDTIPETPAKLATAMWYGSASRLEAHNEVLDSWRLAVSSERT